MVRYEGEKMSKSLGNLVFVSELVKDWDPMAVRLALLDHDHHQAWEWTDGLLPVASERLARWRGATSGGDNATVLDDVRSALDDDLDLPAAVAAVDDAASSGKDVGTAAALLGIAL
jgi:L-cysteine:1D-myo-inositol 2-amino-2-deoxy-alpha-D-glucopyranoside ligase